MKQILKIATILVTNTRLAGGAIAGTEEECTGVYGFSSEVEIAFSPGRID